MTYKRAKKRGSRTYYYLVEGKRINGKVQQKVLKYLGTSPNLHELQLDPKTAGDVAQRLMTGKSTDEVKKGLNMLGLSVTGRIKKVSLVYNPPLKMLTLHVE